MRKRLCLALGGSIAALCVTAAPLDARPERIRPGMECYSDEYVETAGVRDLAEEKNYEEVYQLYTYYEAVYDADERVVVFREYERGEIVFEQRYAYDSAGKLIEPGDGASRTSPEARPGEVAPEQDG